MRILGVLAFIALVGCQSGGTQNVSADTVPNVDIVTHNVVSANSSSTRGSYFPIPSFVTHSVGTYESGGTSNQLGLVRYEVTAKSDGSAEASVKKYNGGQIGTDPTIIVSKRDLPANGSATLSGTVEIVSASRTGYNSNNRAQYDVKKESGNLSLVADFANATLVGSSNLLNVDGVISGRELSGSVSYDGVSGDLLGDIATVKISRRNGLTTRVLSNKVRALGYFSGSDQNLGKTFTGAFSVKE